MFGHIGKQLGYPCSILPVLLEAPKRLHDPLIGAHACLGENSLVGEIQHVAIFLVKKRLVIVAVYLAYATCHKRKITLLALGNKWGVLAERGLAMEFAIAC